MQPVVQQLKLPHSGTMVGVEREKNQNEPDKKHLQIRRSTRTRRFALGLTESQLRHRRGLSVCVGKEVGYGGEVPVTARVRRGEESRIK